MKILIVEDDQPTAQTLKKGLESQCYAVDVEGDGEKGFYRARTNDYDLIILDNMLPGKEGPEVCKGIRQYKIRTPILMLSAWTEVDQKVNLLDCGADDYLTKPYSFNELSARVKALLRRPPALIEENLSAGGLVLDRNAYTVTRDGRPVTLTPKEFSLLEYLMQNAGRVLSRGQILEHVWDGRVDMLTNAIETHIANLRKKIDADHDRKFIHTLSGRGYKFEANT
jgi:DNA-binding response OmpR family regulator